MPSRSFYQYSRAYYAKSNGLQGCLDEIMVVLKGGRGEPHGEFGIRWHSVAGRSVARLESFHDSWKALATMPDLVLALSALDSSYPSPTAICAILKSLGFADETPIEQPR